MAITPCAASRALQAATSPEAMPLRPVQACVGRLGAAVLSPLSLSPSAGGGPHLRPGEAGSAVRLGRDPSRGPRCLKQKASVDERFSGEQ